MYKALWGLALPVSLTSFPASPLPHSSHTCGFLFFRFTGVISTSGNLHLLFPLPGLLFPQVIMSSPNSDFSLNVTTSKRPSLPFQSEVKPPNHYHLPSLIFFISLINKILLFIQLSISSLSRMSTRGTGPCPTCSTRRWRSTFVKWKYKWTWINPSVLVLGREKPLPEVMFLFLPPRFHLTDCTVSGVVYVQ